MLTTLVRRKLLSLKQLLAGNARVSFSQFGEDLLILSALEVKKITKPTYIDIGANDPVRGSNTYLLYQRGFTGVLIEPNPTLYKKIQAERPLDVALNIGIGDTEGEANYYMFPEEKNGLNTFSESEMLANTQNGIPLQQTLKIKLNNINSIIEKYFTETPTVMSIDVEGLDEAILHSLNFEKHKPTILCVETIAYSSVLDGTYTKREDLVNFILSKGYKVFADTMYNTIFVS